jgi:radical SAM protein with 4Fe4S-binding SPASM domain
MKIYGAWLTVNRFCNFRCSWCYAQGTEFKSEDSMPLCLAKDLINLIHAIGIQRLILIGGETLFWKYLFEVATYLKSLGITSTVVSNGWLLGHERYRDKVADSDITAVGISLKAGNRQQNLQLTGFDGFNRVLEGLRTTSSWEHIRIETSTVITNQTLYNLAEIVKVAFDNGAKFMNIQMCGPLIEDGEVFDSQYMASPSDIVTTFMAQYEEIDNVSGGNFSLESTIPVCLWPTEFLEMLEGKNQIHFGCHMRIRGGLLFDRWGKLIPCNHLYDYPMGQFGKDFSDVPSLEKHWMQPELTSFYDSMLAYPAEACIGCDDFGKCGGGCPLQWFVLDPDLVIAKKGA